MVGFLCYEGSGQSQKRHLHALALLSNLERSPPTKFRRTQKTALMRKASPFPAMRRRTKELLCRGTCMLWLLWVCWWDFQVENFALPSDLVSADEHHLAMSGAGTGILYEMIGEYTLPKPVVLSPNASRLWDELGVGVREMGDDAYVVEPQHFSKFRAYDEREATYLRDMEGNTVSAEENPGIRIEPNVVTEAEEIQIVSELQGIAATHGYEFAADGEAGPATSWRLTGRDEKRTESLAPWGWGSEFDKSKLPSALAQVVAKLESLPGYPLGTIRDVTVNMRDNDDYQMVPHIDPLGDGPNSFVLSLLSSAVVTFSPVATLRSNAVRANDDEQYAQHSFTDKDTWDPNNHESLTPEIPSKPFRNFACSRGHRLPRSSASCLLLSWKRPLPLDSCRSALREATRLPRWDHLRALGHVGQGAAETARSSSHNIHVC